MDRNATAVVFDSTTIIRSISPATCFDPANPCLRARTDRGLEPEKRHRVALFIDEGVTLACPTLLPRIARYAATHSATMALAGDMVVVPGGEAIKNQHDSVEHMLRELSSRQIDRQSFAIAVGGGAVLDAVGFAAAIFHRGVRHIRCPTTVLAQDDSGVGVKNAINAFGFKNLLGTFAPPFAVINDSAFLDMLPEREKRGGMAEAVKVALIRDAEFFTWLEREARRARRASQPNALDTSGAALRQAAHAPDRAWRRSVRDGLGPSARLRPLVGAQARRAHPQCVAARRGGRDRRRARRALFGAGGNAAGGRGRARAAAARHGSGFRSGTMRWTCGMRQAGAAFMRRARRTSRSTSAAS